MLLVFSIYFVSSGDSNEISSTSIPPHQILFVEETQTSQHRAYQISRKFRLLENLYV